MVVVIRDKALGTQHKERDLEEALRRRWRYGDGDELRVMFHCEQRWRLSEDWNFDLSQGHRVVVIFPSQVPSFFPLE